MTRNLLKTERIEFIDRRLDELYPDPPVPLDHRDPFTLLVAVLLSAQCTDERVNQVTPSLFELADNPFEMAGHSADVIREIIKPCGLSPQKSKAIRGLSEILIEEHDGELVRTILGLRHSRAKIRMASRLTPFCCSPARRWPFSGPLLSSRFSYSPAQPWRSTPLPR